MEIILNGETTTFGEPITVAELIEHLGLHEKRIVVEHNKLPLARERYRQTSVREGDRIEIVTMLAGG